MKRFIHILAALLGILTVIGGLDLTGFLKILPEGWAAFVATLPPLALAIGHSAIALGDQLDDGQKNGSFPPSGGLKMHPVTFLLAVGIALMAGALSSCKLPEGIKISGYYVDPDTGARANLNTTGNGLGGGVEIPIYDGKGHQTGWVDLHSGK